MPFYRVIVRKPPIHHKGYRKTGVFKSYNWKQNLFYIVEDDIGRTFHHTDECDTRPFLGGSRRSTVSQTRPTAPKCHGPRRHSLKKGRLRRQVISLSPPRKVKAWEDGPLRLEELTVRHGCQTVRWKPLQEVVAGQALHYRKHFSTKGNAIFW